MKKFKVGDKLVLYNTNGDSYGLGSDSVRKARSKDFLTVRAAEYFDDKNNYPRLYFKEVGGYWNPNWFKKINIQLEFDFGETKPKR